MDAARKPKPSRLLTLFVISLFSFAAMLYMLFAFPPGTSFVLASNIQIPYLLIFFLLLFVSLYGMSTFFLKSGVQGMLIAGLVIAFLLLRLFNITHPFFTLLLLVLFLSLEGVVWKRK